MKNHSKETKNVSKNDYYFTQEKRKGQRFSSLFEPRKRRGMEDYYVSYVGEDDTG